LPTQFAFFRKRECGGAKIAAPCSVRAFTRHQGVDKGTQIAQLDGVTVGQNRRLRLNIAFQ
jgi:hypothetical protein